MTYVDAWYDRKRDRIKIAERVGGRRIMREEPVEHVLYYEHPAGTHRTIFGHNCKRFSSPSSRKHELFKAKLLASAKPPLIFESDIRTEFRYLADHYSGAETPVLHVGFFDIEVDFDPDKGFAPPENPFNPITAISINLSHIDRLVTFVLAPPTLTLAEATEMVAPVYDDAGVLTSGFENTFVFDDEKEMLKLFLDIIDEVDVLSGWNSEGFDIPYMVNRIKRILGDDYVKKFCLWGLSPREREYMKFGKKFKTYDIVGRVHLDYLMLYQKHNTQQQHSYRLDFIAEIEVGLNKVPYSGTLDDLYKKEFYKFVDYNRQDVALLVQIDDKKKFIELANQIAHANCVLLKTTVGSVALVEMAIINEMHAMGFVVPDRKPKEEKEEATEEQAKAKKTRVVKKPPQCDDALVEEKLHEFLLAMAPDELADLNEHLIADGADDTVFECPESYIDAFGGYLRNHRPEVMNWIIQTCTTEEEETVEIELEDVDEPTVKIGKDGRTPVVGAYVAQPKKGIHKEVGCIDINSLYPSAIRALNMSPETIVGQVRPDATMALVKKRIEEGTDRAEAWDGIFSLLEVVWMHEKSTEHTFLVDFEDGRTVEMNGAQLNELIFTPSNNLCISANGTIFSTVTEGIIPHLLAKWYSERKTMQAREKSFGDLAKGVDISEELANQLRELECVT